MQERSLIHNDNIFIGYYCVLNASTSTPTDGVTGNECNLGQYCLEGSSEGTGCPAGKNIFIVPVSLEALYLHIVTAL